jgi:putative transcriptional regulator
MSPNASPHVLDQLPELALGTLPDDERATVERHLDGCEACARELHRVNETLAELMFGLDPVEPSPEVRARVLASCERGRFAGFAATFARIFDVTVDRARELLDRIDDPAAWEPGPMAGTGLIHFEAGPACAGADTGFVRVAPGLRFPWHAHNGEETNLVLQGECVDSNGTTYRRGDEFVNPTSSEHDFTAADGNNDYVFAVRVFAGVDFDKPRPGSE